MPYKFEFNPTKKEMKEGYHRATIYFGHGELNHREITEKYINFLGACGYVLNEAQEESIERRTEATGRNPNAEVSIVPTLQRITPLVGSWGRYDVVTSNQVVQGGTSINQAQIDLYRTMFMPSGGAEL